MKVVAKSVLLSISMAALLTVPPGHNLQAAMLLMTAVLVFIA
jgi:hypothetical protein